MTPADYLRLIVLPTFAELLAEPADQRRAYLACITAAHLVDHIAVTLPRRPDGKPDIRAVRSAVNRLGPEPTRALEIVEAVCNGTKHAQPDPKPNRLVKFSPGDEREVGPFAFDDPDRGLDMAQWDHASLYVDHGGVRHFLDDCVRATVRAVTSAFPDRFAGVDLGPVARHQNHYAALDVLTLSDPEAQA